MVSSVSSRTRSLAVATSLVVMLMSGPAGGHVLVTLSHYTDVTVDGVMSPGEYDGTACTDPVTRGAGGTNYTFTVCASNDDVNDYYAVTIDDVTHNTGNVFDNINFFFDNEHDGIAEPCTTGTEDWLFAGAIAPHDLGDGWICAKAVGLEFSGDGSYDGDLAIAFTPGVGYVYEFSHPMKSGNPDDYALNVGNTVGFCMVYDDGANNTNSTAFGEIQFPDGCFSAMAMHSTTQFGDFKQVNAVTESLQKIIDKVNGLIERAPPCPSCPFVFNKLRDARILIERVASAPRAGGNVNMLHGAHGMIGAFVNQLNGRRNLGIDSRTAAALVVQARAIQQDIQVVLQGGALEAPR